MALDRNSIVGAEDTPIKMINVPEWGGDVYVKRPSIRERDSLGELSRQFLELKVDSKGKQSTEFVRTEASEKAFASFRLKTVGFALCDEKGKRLFHDDEIESVLGEKSPEAIERIFNELGNVFKDEEA